jgi:hypothetical protein
MSGRLDAPNVPGAVYTVIYHRNRIEMKFVNEGEG